jgi:hypothetical protein
MHHRLVELLLKCQLDASALRFEFSFRAFAQGKEKCSGKFKQLQPIKGVLISQYYGCVTLVELYPFFTPSTQQPTGDQERLILEVSRSHTMTHHSR